MMKISLKYVYFVTMFYLYGPVYAEPLKLDEEKAIKAIHSVVAEHEIYATCASLDRFSLHIIEENWQREIERAEEELDNLRPSIGFILRFKMAVKFSNLINRSRTLANTIDYCHKHEKQFGKFYTFEFSSLVTAIQSAEIGYEKTFNEATQ